MPGNRGPTGYPTLVAAGLLAYAQRFPASLETYQSVLTTFEVVHVDFDLTVTVPASGRLVVILQGHSEVSNGSTLVHAIWGLLDASNTLIAGTSGQVVSGSTTPEIHQRRIILTNLVPGSTFRCKWGHRTTTATTTGSNIYAGDTLGRYGPATMEIWPA